MCVCVCGFCAYGVTVVVGCSCGGEVEGVNLWIGMVEVWVCGSMWWRFEFMGRHGGGCGLMWWRAWWINVVEV